MLFTSAQFLLFLAACLVLYYIIPGKYQWFLLLVASYVFYYVTGAVYPVFIFVTVLVTYVAAIAIEEQRAKENIYLKKYQKQMIPSDEKKAYRRKGMKKRRRIMLAGLLLMLLLLGVFKYADFAVENVNWILEFAGSKRELEYPDFIMPMGISFYIFQSLGYLLDVYWEKTQAQKNFLKYMLFISFFPQLVQGPISRYNDLSRTLYKGHKFQKKTFMAGSWRMLWGFFKKLVIADNLMLVTSMIFDDEYYTGSWVVLGMFLWAVELYADFSGGINITIGVAQMFGISLQENFIRPYFSKDIAEFWRRWHISMGSWFRDYLFYPVSVSPKLARFSKKVFGKKLAKHVSLFISTMVTWFATGIWHGAGWNFIVWGLANGLVIFISGELKPLYKKFRRKYPKLTGGRGYSVFQVLRTFVLMSFLQMLLGYESVSSYFKMTASIFTDFHPGVLTWEEFEYFGLDAAMYVVLLLGIILMFFVSMAGRTGSVREKIAAKPWIVQYGLFIALVFSVILFGAYGTGYDASQFIYNRF